LKSLQFNEKRKQKLSFVGIFLIQKREKEWTIGSKRVGRKVTRTKKKELMNVFLFSN